MKKLFMQVNLLHQLKALGAILRAENKYFFTYVVNFITDKNNGNNLTSILFDFDVIHALSLYSTEWFFKNKLKKIFE